MEFLRDFYGSNISIFVAFGLFIFWILILGFFQKRAEAKNFSIYKKKWWFWTISIILLINVLFTQLNPSLFGFATPESFVKMKINENEIILFDNKVVYHDTENTSNSYYTSHLRIHVVDRNTHEKRYEELIGTNYFTFIDQNEIFLLKYTDYSEGYIEEVLTYDIKSQEKSTVVKLGEPVNCNGKSIEPYSIEGALGIVVTSKSGEKYIYDSSTRLFNAFDGTYPNFEVSELTNSSTTFYLKPEMAGSDRKVLAVNNSDTKHVFLKGRIFETYSINNREYALIESNEDLTKETPNYSFVSDEGQLMWTLYLDQLEKTVESSGFETIHLFQVDKSLIYMTINAYLFELDYHSGEVNWWLKL